MGGEVLEVVHLHLCSFWSNHMIIEILLICLLHSLSLYYYFFNVKVSWLPSYRGLNKSQQSLFALATGHFQSWWQAAFGE